MILKFSCFCAAGVALLSSTDAFVPSERTTTRALLLHSSLDRDWDNSDFLSSLSGSPDEIAEANAKYQAQAQNRAKMNEWRTRQLQMQMLSSAPPSASSDGGGDPGASPELLRKMMGVPEEEDIGQFTQQNVGQAGQFQAPPPVQQQQPAAVSPAPQQFYDAYGNPVSFPMIYDAYGNPVSFFPPNPQQQQMMQQQQQPAQQIMQPINQVPQLQQQPTQQVQTINPAMQQQPAQQMQPIGTTPSLEPVPWEPPLPPNSKKRGDDPRPQGYNADAYAVSNTADVYFAQLKQDSRVRKRAWLAGDTETANQVFADPTVTSIKEQWVENPYTKEKNIQEARAEIEGAVRMQLGGDGNEDTKFSSGVSYKQKLEQMKAKRGGGGVSAVQQPPPQKVVSKAPPPAQVAPPAPKMQQPPVVQKPLTPIQQPLAPPAPVQPKAVQPKAFSPPAMATPTRAEAATEEEVPGAMSEDEKRRELRTLQGLLLKQRGGPGFGAGRLREAEAQRLETSLEKVMNILRSENGDFVAGTPATASPPIAQAPKPVQPAQPAKPAQPMQPPAPVQPVQPIQSAPAPVQSQFDPMTGSIACVEAALKMYQDASPAERQVMMIPLREALMAAASGANKAIAEAELSAHKAALAAGPSQAAPSMQQAAPMMGFPTTYAVTKADPPAAPAPEEADNVTKLNNAYNALTNAQGSGKLGLKNLSGNEAGTLAKEVESMRGVLLDELNN